MWKVSVFITLCCLFIGTAHAASIDCNIDECRKPMKIYEELGCKPIYGSKSCCPKRFECPDDMKVVKDENKCTFEGIDYKIGEILPRNMTTESKCVEACICSRFEEEPAQFLCTNSDCGISSFKVPGCINIYGDLNECCSTSIVCDDEEKEKLATCWDGDVEYHDGEKFISKSNPCYECLCHEDFDNTTIIEENPHCHKLNCEIELKYKSFIQRGCLPIFENDKCCPVDWKCFDSAKKSKKVVKRSPYEDEDSSDEDDSSEDSIEEDDDKESEELKIPSKAESVQVEPLEITQFLPPFEDETEQISIKENDNVKETTQKISVTEKAVKDEEEEKEIETTQKAVEETTLVSSSDEITTHSSTEASPVSESVTEVANDPTTSKIETTESVTETESTTLSTESTTAITEKPSKDESVEESDEDSSDENIFGGDLKKSDEKVEKSEANSPSSEQDESDITTESSSSSTEINPESTTHPSSSTEIVSESTSEFISEISTEEQTTDTSVKDDSEKSLDQFEETTTEITDFTTTESNIPTEAIKIIEEAKTTEPTLTSAKDQQLTPPVPTQIDMILTTLKELKEYVSKLSLLPTTRTSESEQPASFVNFTVSRSLPITENRDVISSQGIDVRSISKRSLDQKSVYIKFSNKEKGCKVGTQHYRIGEEIETGDKCLACYCNYSPIGHCIKNEKCESN